ncbi:hypothetical protein [Planctopirus ephydatiae]|uniref:hypothetical protein n=1 Tax=Planctopirus ephydatiae TaxID=2528019 RepID=UPI0011A4C569|nr:hypothetical protein [Planctopirus ephydatiae]
MYRRITPTLSPAIKNMDMSKAVPDHDSQLLVLMKAKSPAIQSSFLEVKDSENAPNRALSELVAHPTHRSNKKFSPHEKLSKNFWPTGRFVDA